MAHRTGEILTVNTHAADVAAEDERKSSRLAKSKKLGATITGALVIAGAMTFGNTVNEGSTPRAEADEVVLYCGMGDNLNCDGYRMQLEATGQGGPNVRFWPVPSPNSIWPMGPATARQSVDISMAEGKRVYQDAVNAASPGENVVERGYSLGGLPAAGNAWERTGGGPVREGSLVIDGAPVTDIGVFNPQNELARTFLPLATNMLDVPTHYRAPANAIVRGSEQDVWYNGGRSDLGKLIGQGMDTFFGPAHAVQNPNGFHHVWRDANGVIHNTFPGLGTGGVAPGGPTMGGPGVAPASLRNEDHPRWVPNSPNFRAVSRDWKERHGMELNGASRNGTTRNNTSASTGSTMEDNSRVIVSKQKDGKKSVVRGSTSLRFSPTKR